MKVFISLGHGGEVGAMANGTNEHAEVVAVANKIKQYLPVIPFEVVFVPYEYNLEQRIKFVNQTGTKDDYLLELHMNASGSMRTRGSEVYYYAGYPNLQMIAAKIAENYSVFSKTMNAGPKKDTEVRFGRLGIIRDTKPIAFLIEMGYITNVDDLMLVREKSAYAVVQALMALTGNKYLESTTIPKISVVTTPVDPHKIAVDWAITTKVSNGERPKETATREEVLHMIFNYHKFLKNDQS